MNIKTVLKTSVAAAALFAVAAPAQAGSVTSKNDNFSVKLTGQFNKAVMYGDNGAQEGIAIGDNNTSRSRFWITPSGNINESLSIKGRVEVRASSNRLSTISLTDSAVQGNQSTTDTQGTGDLALTETWFALQHKQMGTLQIGLHAEAYDGANEAVFNPAGSVVDHGDITDGDAIAIHTAGTTDSTASGLRVTDFFDSYHGGDTDNVTYISPTIAGFALKGTLGTGGDTALGLYYGGKFGSFAVKGGLGMVNQSAIQTSPDKVYGYSLGVKHDSGFSISGGAGYEDVDGATATTAEGEKYFIIAGYEANLTSMGKTGFAIQYLKNEDTTVVNDEGTIIAFGVEQGLATGVSVYAGAQLIEVERPGVNYDDVTTIMVGSKVSF